MKPGRRTQTAAFAAALLLVAAGCSGGDGSDSDGAGPPPSSTATADDQAVAERANVRLSDFPPEWQSTAVAAASKAANAEGNRVLADCMGRPRGEDVRTAIAESADFSAQDTRRASSAVQVVRSSEIAEGDFAALKTDKAIGCHKAQIDAEFRRQLPTEASPQTTLERLPLPQFGDDTAAFRVVAMSVAQGVQVRTYIDLVFIRKGRAELSANFLNVGAPFPADLERSLLQRMVGRA